MTKRITISVPDDVAAHLERVGDGRVSRYVVDAVRRTAEREAQQRALSDLYDRIGAPSEEDRARAEQFADRVETWRAGRLRADIMPGE
jgi:hypothetical protein